MALLDRIFRDQPPGYDGYIPNHAFSALVWFWATGRIGRAEVVARLGLDASDDAQLDEMVAYYQSLSNQDQKRFHSDIEAAGILAEDGLITRAEYKALFGMS